MLYTAILIVHMVRLVRLLHCDFPGHNQTEMSSDIYSVRFIYNIILKRVHLSL